MFLAELLERWWSTALLAAGGIVMFMAQLLEPGWHAKLGVVTINRWWVSLIGIAAFVVGTFSNASRLARLPGLEFELQDSQDLLQAERDRSHRLASAATQSLRDAANVELSSMTDALKFYSDERISLYAHVHNGFELVGRISRNPKFQDSTGRSRYPEGEGCLGRAWDDGQAYLEPLLEPLPDPSDLSAWLDAQLNIWGVPKKTATQFTMKSRTYIAYRIGRLPEHAWRGPLGVIVFESRRLLAAGTPAVLDPNELAGLVKSIEGQRLRSLLEIRLSQRGD